jgi:hypothetical protein
MPGMPVSPKQVSAKKHKVPKIGGEKGTFFTQVGELDDEAKEPTPAMRIKRNAHDEKVYATRDWVAGRINNKKHSEIHSRANHAIKNAHKLGRVEETDI